MFRKLASIAAGVTLALASVAASAAVWTQNHDPNDIYIGNAYTYTHDLTTQGFQPGIDTIDSFTLTLWLYDDSWFDGAERAEVNLPGSSFDEQFNVSIFNVGYSTGGAIGVTYSLNATGLLTYTLTADRGDFMFDRSRLTAEGTDRTGGNVPEPASLALVGLALAGIGAQRRRAAKK